MILFGIHCKSFIVLPIRLKTCRSNVFSFLQDKHARLGNQAHLRRFARPNASDQHRERNLSRPVEYNLNVIGIEKVVLINFHFVFLTRHISLSAIYPLRILQRLVRNSKHNEIYF